MEEIMKRLFIMAMALIVSTTASYALSFRKELRNAFKQDVNAVKTDVKTTNRSIKQAIKSDIAATKKQWKQEVKNTKQIGRAHV